MDVSDLRSELARRADQMPAGLGTAARMAAVRRRVRARRQRLAGGVVGVAVLGAGAVVVLPAVVGRDTGQVVEPAAPTQTPKDEAPGTVAFEPGTWPSRINGNTFLTGRVTEPGDDTARWTMTVPTLDVSVSLFCHLDRQEFPRAVRDGSVVSDFAINGNPVFGSSCGSERTLRTASLLSDLDSEMMRDFGVRPGKPFTVEMSLERYDRAARKSVAMPDSRALLGLGLYAQDGDVRQVTKGWSLPVVQGRPGDERQLTELYTARVPRSRTLGPVETYPQAPAGNSVSYGWLVRGYRSTYQLLKDGRVVEQSTAGGISSGVPIDGQHRLEVRARGGRTEGTLVLGIYEPVTTDEATAILD